VVLHRCAGRVSLRGPEEVVIVTTLSIIDADADSYSCSSPALMAGRHVGEDDVEQALRRQGPFEPPSAGPGS
jgi:hypothetical protein